MAVDQASGQSTETGSVELSQADAVDLFDKYLNGGTEPKGQPDPEQEGTDPEINGDQPDVEAEGKTPEAELIEVPKLEGEGTEKITRDELKSRMLMQADYTRKTQEVAEQRKAIVAESAKSRQEIAQRISSLDESLQRASTIIQSIEAQVNWDALRQVDPSAYLEQRELQGQRIRAYDQAKSERDSARAAAQQDLLAENHQRLIEAIPGWLDPTTAEREQVELASALVKEFNFTEEEVGKLADYRVVLMARYAAKYLALQAKAKDVKANVEKAPKLSKPGAPQAGNAEALQTYNIVQRAKKTGDIKDAAAAFSRLM